MKLAIVLDWRRRRAACALACFLIFADFQLFAAVPQLHNWLHSDSAESGHHCSLTLLTQGQVNTTVNDGVVKIMVAAPYLHSAPAGEKIVLSAYRQLPPGRAPPA